ncbi:glycoside hydrolase family 13 protein [Lacticaseibacillus saniviri]|uniref:Neopullulanase n=1 Tax=Lacticaseibacillus saniviri JCM 17471 = DSM 24301 TaxID=1293598 RepID=A0A0R2MX21_9LACO|nr:glycoside hydrolase family 13 protein [Lacticaseibacillus saniviri]KRO18065.1 Neopullulanase [Lacticaseibacillus saniviri JCM 17471 = DSM 24301]MCG4282321.1 glycoside hydrolase family 13 protein [Lacticaseibacillus saniviri]
MELAAITHRPESEDAFLYTPDHLRLRLHTKRDDIAKVTVLYADPYWSEPTADGAYRFAYQEQALTILGEGQVHTHWGAEVTVPYRRIQYLFSVTDHNGDTYLYGDRGLRPDTEEERQSLGNYFKLPYFHEIDRVKTPDWVKDTVWYQIFPERFANGDTSNDPVGTLPWNPSDHPSRDAYYGGDLQGVLDHMDDLVELGVNGIYFNPLFKAQSNHKYDTLDYFEIDPDFGDKALFAQVIEEAHKRGIKVMLDAVFNHLGNNSLQWQDVIKHGQDSRFADWFHIQEFPVTPYRNPINGEGDPQFDTFAFGEGMPKLNTANPEVKAFLLEIATYWIKQFDIDAWRLDVANEIDHRFWKEFADACLAIKPDFYILGEIWHSSQTWLNGDEFSGVMNYAYTQLIEDYYLKHALSTRDFTGLLTDQLMKYRDQTNQVMLNMLDSHDTPRLLTLAHDNKALMFQTIAFTFLQPGSPCIYYGTEMGMDGENDPDDRKPMDWSQKGAAAWQQTQKLVQFRTDHAHTLSRGEIQFETVDGLLKVTRTGEETIVGYFNPTAEMISLDLPAFDQSQNYVSHILQPNGYVMVVA